MPVKISNSQRLAKLPYHIMLGLSAAAVSSAPAIAQTDASGEAVDADDEESDSVLEEVIVTGMRSSLMSSQNMRQDSSVILDAVTAEDIGALPDRSVNEVLQRIPGVAISRFEGSSDPDHFSVEGSGTVIRGLSFVRSELNGRDVFTADSGQALGFNSVSPELMGAVQVFKNQSADMIEGGIGGTVNLVTRKPFDADGQVVAFSAEANYGDMAKDWTPAGSFLYSNVWDTASGGRFGVLASVAYSRLKSRSDGTLVADWLDRDGSGTYIPAGAGIRTSLYDRKRTGYSASLQWENADGDMEATFEFFRSSFDTSWGEHALEPSIDDSPTIIPREGTEFTIGNDGLFESGVISESVGWRSNSSRIPLNGVRQLALRRENQNKSHTTDYNLNYKWAITDQWRTQFDYQHVDSSVKVDDYSLHGAVYADMDLDITSGSGIPSVNYWPPLGQPDDQLTNPYNYYVRSIMDHIEDNDGDEDSFRADAEYDFEGSDWARSIRFGGRLSNRKQTVRYTTYNWGSVSNNWTNQFFLDDPRLPEGSVESYSFNNYMRGDVPGRENVPFYSGPMTPEALQQFVELAGNGGWMPVGQRDGVVEGTPFLPAEINDTKQKTQALYFRFDFGWEFDNAMYLDGNVGLRYVKTKNTATGGIVFPSFQNWLGDQTLEERCTPQEPGANTPGFCDLPPSEQAAYAIWADGSSVVGADDKYNYSNWLPSLNLKLGLTDDMNIRFAYSTAISRPDFGLLKSNFLVDFGDDDPITGEWLGPDSSTAEVRLDPIKANQFDLAWEWFFADVGSITVTGFYKKLKNYIVPATQTRDFENNGVTWPVAVEGVGNAEDDGKIKGVEFAYQQVYDMLPGFWGGFGTQLNYTYVDANGLPIVQPKSDEPNGSPSAPNFDVSGLRLPGLSKHTANAVLFWEDDRFSARLAYNYRSSYTLTTRDVIYPFTPILHAPTGQLDGSFFWTINDNFKLGLQAINLTNEVTKTRSVYNEDLDYASRSYFMNDRRYSLILRAVF